MKRKDNNKQSYIFTRETLGMTILLFCALLFITLLTHKAVFASIGGAICTFMYGTFGYASYLVLAAFAYLGEWLVFEKKINISAKLVASSALVIFMLFLLFHAVSTRAFELNGYGSYISECYMNAQKGYAGYTFGGVISALIVYPIAKATTFVGAYIIFSLLTVLAGYLLFMVVRRIVASESVENINNSADASKSAQNSVGGANQQYNQQHNQFDNANQQVGQSAFVNGQDKPADGLYSVGANYEIINNRQTNTSQNGYVQNGNVKPSATQPSAEQQQVENDDDKFSPKKLGRKILFENGEFAAESYRRNMIFNESSYFNHPVQNEGDYLSSFSSGKKPANSSTNDSYSQSYSQDVENREDRDVPPSYINGDKPVDNFDNSDKAVFESGERFEAKNNQPDANSNDFGLNNDYSNLNNDYSNLNNDYSNLNTERPVTGLYDNVDNTSRSDTYRNNDLLGSTNNSVNNSNVSNNNLNAGDLGSRGDYSNLGSQDASNGRDLNNSGSLNNYNNGRDILGRDSRDVSGRDTSNNFGSSDIGSNRGDSGLYSLNVPERESRSESNFDNLNNGRNEQAEPRPQTADSQFDQIIRRSSDDNAGADDRSSGSLFSSLFSSSNSRLPKDNQIEPDSSRLGSRRQEETPRSNANLFDDIDNDLSTDDAFSGLGLRGSDDTSARRTDRVEGADSSVSDASNNNNDLPVSSTGDNNSSLNLSSERRGSVERTNNTDNGNTDGLDGLLGRNRETPFEQPKITINPPTQKSVEKAAEPVKPVEQEKPKHVWKKYVRPTLDLLDDYPENSNVNTAEIEDSKSIIVETLSNFRIASQVANVVVGPAITRYDVIIEDRTNIKNALKYKEAIAMALMKENVTAYLNYSKGAISIEVPNSSRTVVGLKGMLASSKFINCKPNTLTFTLGKNVEGQVVCPDITKMPHLLVAGTTGSGKSICLSTLIVSLLYKYGPEELRFILVDPKQVEFISYDKLPHLMINEIIYDVDKAIKALNWAIKEMERRYQLFKEMTEKGVATKSLTEYNAHLPEGEEKLPKIVIILDEFGDLMLQAKKEIESRIIRLVQKARACGIHLILATQRPSVDCITGLIKSNLPTRIGFKVNSFDDARTIFDIGGAEKLLGKGDMYYRSAENPELARIQGCFIDTHEVQRVTDFIKQNNETYFDQSVSDFINTVDEVETDGGSGDEGTTDTETKIDDTFIKALKFCVTSNQASVSMIQRRFPVGYIKACKIIDWMENMNYVTQAEGSKPRKVLLSKEEFIRTYGDVDD